MNLISEKFVDLWRQAFEIWISGGWGMIAIAVNAFVLFAMESICIETF